MAGALDWYNKYGKRLKQFEQAKRAGIRVDALDTRPELTSDEQFYFSAYGLLANAQYTDIKNYCEDYCFSKQDKEDLIQVIKCLRIHSWRKSDADSRTNDRQHRSSGRGGTIRRSGKKR